MFLIRPTAGALAHLSGRRQHRWARVAITLALPLLYALHAFASGPRWTRGAPYYSTQDGLWVSWYTNQPQYFTDPGDLSPYVNHAAADSLVASAAATWNYSMASLTLAQGGSLDEHVSGANVYLGAQGPVFPADVQASNYSSKQIAVIYDSDGSVTDTLLGGGASDPGNCRQSAVTESVDSISPDGHILHALLILNGRCTGSAAALQLEMKYRLIRAFGRLLGLGWSQLNDNVFTQSPQPTTQQALNWPILHPIDILCGPYAYQCMQQPFTLRTDDLDSLIMLYPVWTSGNGKTASYDHAASMGGQITFPNGQSMEGLLVSVRRFHFGPGYSDAYDLASSVTGFLFQQMAGTPVAAKGTAVTDSNGGTNPYLEGYYWLSWIPISTDDYFDNLTVTTSAVNPLYTGQYAVGPYAVSQVTPSGPPVTATQGVVLGGYHPNQDMVATTAPSSCNSGGDGIESSPLPVPSSGMWSDTLCGYQHDAWSTMPVKAGRTFTIDATAVDEQGYATTGKMLPVLGVWDSGDPMGSQPTLAFQAAPLNAINLGMTRLIVSNATARQIRFDISDMRGAGRPDFGYNVRVLYADSITPASLPANGGVVTISGLGFRPGNTVTVHGVAANVTNWTSDSITLVAPAITGPLAADIVVTDLSTGAQTSMSGALTYRQTADPYVLSVVSKPADGGYVGSAGSPDFKVRVLLPDGATPAASLPVSLSSSAATFAACSNTSPCALTTDASGLVHSAVTPTTPGTVTLTASTINGSVSTSYTAAAVPIDTLTVTSLPSGTVYATVPAQAQFGVQVSLPDGTPASGARVTVTATNATLGACQGASTCILTADANGQIATAITPSAPGTVSLLATATGGMVSASFPASALPSDVLTVLSKPADGSYAGAPAASAFTVRVLLGDNTTPASGASVTLSASGATLALCGAASCVFTADANGLVSTSVIPSAPGTVTLTASAGGGSVSTSFTAQAAPPDVLHVDSTPANGSYTGSPATAPFSVSVRLADGVTPAAGASVTITTSGGTFAACGRSTCSLTANSAGSISAAVTAIAPGTITLMATAGGGSVSTTYTASAPPDTIQVTSQPADHSPANHIAAAPFSVRVLVGTAQNNRIAPLGLETPAAGESVTLSATGARLEACGASTCTLTADSSGSASTPVTPLTAGVVTLRASAAGGNATSNFTADTPPDTLRVTSIPANGSYANRAAAAPFSVAVLLDDGTPAAGASVTISATNAFFAACSGVATCVLTADASGTVSTSVTPQQPGLVSLQATAGGGSTSAAFTASALPPHVLSVTSVPASPSYVGSPAASPFTVHVLLGDGTTPAVGAPVTLSASGATLGVCGGTSCSVIADASGNASTTVTPTTPGTVTLNASAGGGTASASFTAQAPPDVLSILSTPADGSYVGHPASAPFTIQVSLGYATNRTAARLASPNGVHNPDAGAAVTLTATGATFDVCGLSTCTLTSDSTGTVSTTVTPNAAGSISLSATAAQGSASTSFVAAAPATLRVVTLPADGSPASRAAAMPFAVRVLLGDGQTPASGVQVSLTASNAILSACAGPACILVADANGIVSTSVSPSAAGTVLLSAAASGGAISAAFNAADPVRSIAVTRATEYVATGATVQWSPAVALVQNDALAASVGVSWTGAPGLAVTAQSSTSDSSGLATIPVAIGPLASGASPQGRACAWQSICTSFNAKAVDPEAWRLTVESGAAQSVASTGSLLPVTLRALDDAGHWVAGVPVQVHQVVRGWVACPTSGRCPVGPVLATDVSTVTSDVDGLLTIQPLEVPGFPSTTEIVAAAGPSGYTTVTLSKTP